MPAHHTVHGEAFYPYPEWVGGRDVLVCLLGGRDWLREASSVRHHLGYLPPGDVITRLECAIGISRDDTPASQAADILIERVGSGHVREGDGARCGRGGWWRWHGRVGGRWLRSVGWSARCVRSGRLWSVGWCSRRVRGWHSRCGSFR